MNKYFPAIATALTALLIVVLLLVCRLSFDLSTLPVPPRPVTELVVDEEFVDLLSTPLHAPSDPSAAYAPEPVDAASTPAETAGSDLHDQGRPAPANTDVGTSAPSPVQTQQRPPQPAGPSREEIEREEARRRARQGMADAFNPTPGTNNTANTGAAPGDSGNPSGTVSDSNGSGHGTVGGGWVMPSYRRIPSPDTGSIIIEAIVNREGRAVEVYQTGGKAPAAANNALVERCIAEVRSRRFTRADNNPPERAVATITYSFR